MLRIQTRKAIIGTYLFSYSSKTCCVPIKSLFSSHCLAIDERSQYYLERESGWLHGQPLPGWNYLGKFNSPEFMH